jgi:hypothetical protein
MSDNTHNGLDDPAVVQHKFLDILPRIELHARVYFRHLKCPHRKEDAVAEAVALAWAWHLRLAQRGKDATQFPSALATYAARAVKCGRRVAGVLRAKDVANPAAQQRHRFKVEPLPFSHRAGHERLYSDPKGQELHDAYEERLRDNTLTPVPDQVAFRIDFAAWLATLTGRERRMIRLMVRNERTLDLSRRFEVCPARISQMRQEFHHAWQQFHGEA